MNRLLFRQRLNHLHEDALRFQNTLCAYETTDAVRYPENFERLGLDMAMVNTSNHPLYRFLSSL